jgi:hypothetical protein
MRKFWTAVLVGAVLIATFAALFVMKISPPPAFKSQVGIFFYVWYDPASEESWNRAKIADQPVWGYYDSSDPAVIRQQLLSIEELGVDFVVISWWGFYDGYGKFADRAAQQVFETAQGLNSTLKFAVMVEPFNKTGNLYDFGGIYDYVFDTFTDPYSSLYYSYRGKPLICFFNNENLTGNGVFPEDERSRFNVVTVGQQSYTDWIYTDLNIHVKAHEPDGQISVTPRFDDSRYRTPSCVVDSNLTEGVYDREWNNALKLVRERKVSVILISSWNEYIERTQIEPFYDGTSAVPSDFLYNKTKEYIARD